MSENFDNQSGKGKARGKGRNHGKGGSSQSQETAADGTDVGVKWGNRQSWKDSDWNSWRDSSGAGSSWQDSGWKASHRRGADKDENWRRGDVVDDDARTDRSRWRDDDDSAEVARAEQEMKGHTRQESWKSKRGSRAKDSGKGEKRSARKNDEETHDNEDISGGEDTVDHAENGTGKSVRRGKGGGKAKSRSEKDAAENHANEDFSGAENVADQTENGTGKVGRRGKGGGKAKSRSEKDINWRRGNDDANDSALARVDETIEDTNVTEGAKGGGKRGKRGEDRGSKSKAKKDWSREVQGEEAEARRANQCKVDPSIETGSLADRLVKQLNKGTYDCMICLGKVTRQQSVWNCRKCWAVFHLKCIKSWIHKANSDVQSDTADVQFPCPGCRYIWIGPRPQYTCFCEKLFEPQASPHITPHSCGEVCELNRGCPHPCPALCHPGPCPPCTAIGPPGHCHCGADQREKTKCGESTRWSCGAPCRKLLACGKHTCHLKCHAGECPPCTATVRRKCLCGSVEDERPCIEEEFRCDKPCGKLLPCGQHYCEQLCHDGDCGSCPLEPKNWGDRCACGKTTSCSSDLASDFLQRWVGQRQRCVDPLPLCNQICNRPHVECGHRCQKKCHEGPCGNCTLTSERDCRCKKKRRAASCQEGEILCNTRCSTLKSCGRHRCDTVCCEGRGERNHPSHLCILVCGKRLPCGLHECNEFCHLGPCPPCRVVSRVPLCCACGAATIEPPVPCGMEPPFCDLQCGYVRECGHSCQALCHFGEHPPCTELVDLPCFGGHQVLRNRPCHIGITSCGAPCGKRLPCRHNCNALCHAGDCPPCSQPCGAPRLRCEHKCEHPCHPGSDCPDVPCKRRVRTVCPCGINTEDKICGAYSKAAPPRHAQMAPLKCNAKCEQWHSSARPPPKAAEASEPEQYTADLFQLAMRNKRYCRTLEGKFALVISSGKPVVLPPCDTQRRHLACEYANMYFGLRTRSKPDSAVEDYWEVTVELGPKPRGPRRPLLSDMNENNANLVRVPEGSPCLHFGRVAAPGDELYSLAGDGFLGLRAQGGGEVLALYATPSQASSVFRRLARGPPGPEPVALRVDKQPNLRMSLENTIGSAAAARQRLNVGGGLEPVQSEAGDGGWDAQKPPTPRDSEDAHVTSPDAGTATAADVDAEGVPDSWEDDL